MLQKMEKEWALVTGASQGIGLALAQCFAQDGINLVLVARSGERLNALAVEWARLYNILVVPVVADLEQLDAPDKIVAAIERNNIGVTYLVNNAGVGLFGRYQDTNIDREQHMILLNCVALTRLTKLLLPGMLNQRRGRIVNVASTASFQPGPRQAVYFATKAFVLSFSEAIAEDLRGTGVSVTALCPGLTDSGFVQTADMAHSDFVKRSSLATPEFVAAKGYVAMKKQKRVVVVGFLNRWLAQMPRFFPRRWVTWMVAMMMGPVPSPSSR